MMTRNVARGLMCGALACLCGTVATDMRAQEWEWTWTGVTADDGLMDLDASGRAHFVYSGYRIVWDGTGMATRERLPTYAVYDGDTWYREPCPDVDGTIESLDVAADGTVTAIFGYWPVWAPDGGFPAGWTNERITAWRDSHPRSKEYHQARRDGTGWTVEQVATNPIPLPSRTATDSLGRTHTVGVNEMLYLEEGLLGELTYTVNDGGVETSTTLREDVIGKFSIQLDSADQPHLLYFHPGPWVPGPNHNSLMYGYATAIPEPSTWVLLAMAAIGLWLVRRRRH